MSDTCCTAGLMPPQGVHLDEGVRLLYGLSKDQLVDIIVDSAKNWLAHDGLWFQAIETTHGMEAAMDADREAWRRFTVIEAQRIMARLGIEPGGGIPALVECLKHRLYARLNLQQSVEVSATRALFQMVECRVQVARKRKGLPDFPCKSVGIVEYAEFARTVDPRIETRCVACPPDPHPDYFWCAWEFTLRDA
ncbi:DUF6125 family protein [Geobacter pickeringii]|uniref:Cytosolic protein n=1 Tax=Geobacter pickeringii TaxID=345632 RepID=A0A0B5BDB0_9BACT|nr:DUF6125 family protein [Geobacter pickeringii]AJE04708.1 hypothetical protein GPICK_16200 [Geobacter pickeringii]